MKMLHGTDRNSMYKIEAARHSRIFMHQSLSRILEKIAEINSDEPSIDLQFGYSIFSDVWSVVDHAYRVCILLKSIRGMKHKEPGMKRVLDAAPGLTAVRNHIQHVDGAAHEAESVSYPILGAVSWPANNSQTSVTIVLGTQPTDTKFHTLWWDVANRHFLGGVTISVGTQTIDLQKAVDDIEAGCEQLDKLLEDKYFLTEAEIERPHVFMMDEIDTGDRKKGKIRALAKYTVLEIPSDKSQKTPIDPNSTPNDNAAP